MSTSIEWDLLRTFETVARLGSLTAAARALGVSQSTVSRQLGKLEHDAGSTLLLRESPVRVTERGAALLAAIQPMVEAALAAEAALADAPEPGGEVTIATVAEIARWTLVDQLPALLERHPRLRLRILASNELRSLAAGEADLALRFARPQRGELVARRLTSFSYGYFAAERLCLDGEVDWLGLAGSLAQIPEQRWAERAFGDRPARLLVEDLEALGRAVAAGLGVAILPRELAGRLPGVVEVDPEQVGADPSPVPDRGLWLVVHRSKQRVATIRAVMTWLLDMR